MQVKCHRCSKRFTQVSTEKQCKDCMDRKPAGDILIKPKGRDTSNLIECEVCGDFFKPKRKGMKICSFECGEIQRKRTYNEWRRNNDKY